MRATSPDPSASARPPRRLQRPPRRAEAQELDEGEEALARRGLVLEQPLEGPRPPGLEPRVAAAAATAGSARASAATRTAARLDRPGQRVAPLVGPLAGVGDDREDGEAPALRGVDRRRPVRQRVAGEPVERQPGERSLQPEERAPHVPRHPGPRHLLGQRPGLGTEVVAPRGVFPGERRPVGLAGVRRVRERDQRLGQPALGAGVRNRGRARPESPRRGLVPLAARAPARAGRARRARGRRGTRGPPTRTGRGCSRPSTRSPAIARSTVVSGSPAGWLP